MPLIPAQNSSRGAQIADVKSKPAPIGGWNARDPISNMNEKDAIYLDNFFPNSTSVQLRNGSMRYAYGLGKLQAFTRASTATYFDANNVLQSAAINAPRFAQIVPYQWQNPPPLIEEAAATNYALWSRDLTNAAWVKTNVTALKNQVGMDSVVNAASSITATVANGTVLQALTMPAGGYFGVFIKRLAGVGNISITVDNGATWLPITTNTATWVLGVRTGGLLNPTVGFKIDVLGDSFAIDLVQAEVGVGASVTSYIPTTGATANRSADVPIYLAGANKNTNPADVDTIIEYAAGTMRKMLGWCNGALFDITAGGVAGTPVGFGFTSSRWQYVNQGGYACMFNGDDAPQGYNGTVLAALTITGPSNINLLDAPCVYGGRIFTIEKSTLNVWYGGIGAIQGAFTKLDFSGLFRRGGRLVCCGTWSRDGGSGAEEYIIFVSNMGEVLVYTGDPALAATWSKVGLFRTAPPVGERPLVKVSQDIVLITSNGFMPLSMILPLDRAGDAKYAINDKIRNAVSEAWKAYGTSFGWEAILYPAGNMLMFNIPVAEGETSHQYVINTITGSWCRFIGLNAMTWALSNEKAYFGAPNGYVALFDVANGGDDPLTTYTGSLQLTALQWDLKTAQNYFGTRTREKHFKQIRPVLGASGKPIINIALNMDFEDKYPQSTITVGGGGSQWDVSFWDVAQWDSGIQIRKTWINAPGTGYSASLRMRGQTTALNVVLYSIDYSYEMGGVM